MAFVLVHGGGFSSTCWYRLVPCLSKQVLTVDLPGRGRRPADLGSVTLDDFASAVVEDIIDADLTEVVLVGHSLAGVTLPRVMTRVPERLRHVVFVSCAIPPHGVAVVDVVASLSPVVSDVFAQLGDDAVRATGLHPDLATAMFCNDMDAELTASTLALMGPEAVGVIGEPADLTGLARPIDRTYIRLLRDASLTLEAQDRMVAQLGDAHVVDLDAGHMAMISAPDQLAALLNSI